MRITLNLLLLLCVGLAGCATQSSVRVPADGWERLDYLDYGGALRSFEREIEEGASASSYAGRARALFLLGRLDAAEASYKQAIDLDPEDSQWHLGLSLVHLAGGRADRALVACEAALTFDPGCSKAYYNRGFAHQQLGDPHAALRDYGQALAHDPANAQAYNSRGVVHASMNHFRGAASDFTSALQFGPLAGAHANRAAAFYALGRVEDALVDLNTAIKLERSSPRHLVQRGRVYMDLERANLALDDFAQALALNPGDARTAELLAQARSRTMPAQDISDH